MLEALLNEGNILKKVIDATKDLVTQANFDCVPNMGIQVQAMDSNHVALVNLLIRADGFDHFRCDRNISLGINLTSMAKILKCAGGDDSITIKAEEGGDSVNFAFESKKQTRISQFALKLIDLEADHLGIPDTSYQTVIKMPAGEFKRIINEIQILGDTVTISATKDGVKFSVAGDIGNGNIVVKQSEAVDENKNDEVSIKLEEEVSLTFALRYLNFFAKAATLSEYVTLKMSANVPLVVEYSLSTAVESESSSEEKKEKKKKKEAKETKDLGFLRFYLAPKIEDENEAGTEEKESKETKESSSTDESESKSESAPKEEESEDKPKVKKEKSEDDS
eukprot:TRINITY_DN697_c1_g1_i1.p2 TRINITY_DN697_c1_g1~~TRINITY_DN697_c1_g1_i1.p2  ORF type:complete len:336 (+),score=120.65 TRINITY_DN697_c1_g1_i1:50-1057(+)